LWRDYRGAHRGVAGRAPVLAAAAEYALCRIDGAAVKQRDLAERYGVSLSALQARYAAIRDALKLVPRDGRYSRVAPPRTPDEEIQ
jgi:transcription initiation factor TFIIIB Brf1 subunit/transcription initiation factor TFIIB